jgi:hypothetical protein
MSPHNRHIDRTIREPQWAMRAITIAILLAGAAVVMYAFTRAEARRERALDGLQVGDTTTQVVERLGEPPHVCPTGALTHLEDQFSGGWPAAARARAIETLRQQTAERWVYPLRDEHTSPCAAPTNATEFGIGHDRRVLWLIPLAGRQPLRLPESFAPGTINNDTL